MPKEAERVSIVVPASSANVGLYFDAGCLGLRKPELKTTLTRRPQSSGIEYEAKTTVKGPEGRYLGFAGKLALEHLLDQHGIKEGIHLLYEDTGYPVGGLGRSGAEAVGAIMAAAVIYEIKMDRNQVVRASAKGEPGEHMDNVAGSTNGRFNLIARAPYTSQLEVDVYDVPENLGVAIGISSHQKTTGTEGMRAVLQNPVTPKDFIEQGGLIASATAALIKGDTDRFLDLVWGDRFHEPRRADIGGYGNFNAQEFAELKRKLYEDTHIALNVSGAGPNMQILYNKDRFPQGISSRMTEVESWFKNHGVELMIAELGVATSGAFDHAVQNYNYQ